MSAIGYGLVFVGYTFGLWGVFLITGKNVSVGQLFGTQWPPNPVAAKSPAAATAGS